MCKQNGISYLNTHTKLLQNIANISITITLAVTVCFSWVNNQRSLDQIKLSAKALEADLFYQVLRRGRELNTLYSGGKVSSSDIFAYFQTSHILKSRNIFKESTWGVIKNDLCNTMNDEKLKQSWVGNDQLFYEASFVVFMNSVLNNSDDVCKGN